MAGMQFSEGILAGNAAGLVRVASSWRVGGRFAGFAFKRGTYSDEHQVYIMAKLKESMYA